MFYLSDNLKIRMELQQLQLEKLHRSEKVSKMIDYVFAITGISVGILSFVYLISKAMS